MRDQMQIESEILYSAKKCQLFKDCIIDYRTRNGIENVEYLIEEAIYCMALQDAARPHLFQHLPVNWLVAMHDQTNLLE